MGFEGVGEVRAGKIIELELSAVRPTTPPAPAGRSHGPPPARQHRHRNLLMWRSPRMRNAVAHRHLRPRRHRRPLRRLRRHGPGPAHVQPHRPEARASSAPASDPRDGRGLHRLHRRHRRHRRSSTSASALQRRQQGRHRSPATSASPAPPPASSSAPPSSTWFRKHQDQANRQASGIVLRALDDTYICPGEQHRVAPAE